MKYLVFLISFIVIVSKSYGQLDKYSCAYGDSLALDDFTNGKMSLIYGERGFKFANMMEKKFQIEMNFIGCLRQGYENCYNAFMEKKIDEKFGLSTVAKMRKKAGY